MITILVDNSAWHFSPYNWRISGSIYIESNTPGAYCEIIFSGTSAALLVDVSTLSSYAAGKYPYLRYSIDGGSFTNIQLTSSSSSISVASGLSNTNHTLRVDFTFCDASSTDRWLNPNEVFRIIGLNIDDGASVSSVSIPAKKAIWFGDSISEAVWDDGTYTTGNAMNTCIPLFTSAINCDMGKIAFQSQGYMQAGVGNIPRLHLDGNTVNTAWNKYDVNNSRLVSTKLSPVPDYIFIWHGTNDGAQSDANLKTTIKDWLGAIRSACNSSTRIFVIVPSTQAKASAIAAAVSEYKSSNPSDLVWLIDTGINYSANTIDSVHLTTTGHQLFFNDAWPLIQPYLGIVSFAKILNSSKLLNTVKIKF